MRTGLTGALLAPVHRWASLSGRPQGPSSHQLAWQHGGQLPAKALDRVGRLALGPQLRWASQGTDPPGSLGPFGVWLSRGAKQQGPARSPGRPAIHRPSRVA